MLEATLASLATLDVPSGVQLRVVVVANACTDDTHEVVRRWRAPFECELLVEATPGLSYARNRVLAYASDVPTDFIVWCDDDVEFTPGYLHAYVNAFSAHPDQAVFGGRITPRFLPPSPPELALLIDTVGLNPFSCLNYGDAERDIDPTDRLPFGANMAVRATASTLAGRFDPRLGVTPTRKVGYEENVYLKGLLAGVAWRYVPDAAVLHLLPPRRQSREAVNQWFRAIGQYEGFIATNQMPAMRIWWGAPRWIWRQRARLLIRMLGAILRRDDRALVHAQIDFQWIRGYLEGLGEDVPPAMSQLIR